MGRTSVQKAGIECHTRSAGWFRWHALLSAASLVAGLLALCAPAAKADPAGGEFQVNTYIDDSQMYPTAAMDADGDFVITWLSFGTPGNDAGISVWAQRYSSVGVPQGAEFQVNTYTDGGQRDPKVAMDADGDFVIVWTSQGSAGTDSSGWSVQGQRYSAAGIPQGGEFQVNTHTASDQNSPAVAMDADGDFVVTWTSYSSGTDASGTSVQAQRFDAAGVPQGFQFEVNTHTFSFQELPAVAMEGDGDFVISWTSRESGGSDTSVESVQARRYNADGVAQGREFQVNTFTDGFQGFSAIALGPEGDSVITWNSLGSAGTDAVGYSIQGQRYDAVGAPAGGEFQVNTFTNGHQLYPSVAMDGDGDFVITWTSDGSAGSDQSSFSIQGQRFNAPGAPEGGEFQVNSYTNSAQMYPEMAMDPAGNWVVTWLSFGSGGTDSSAYSVQAQRFSASPEVCNGLDDDRDGVVDDGVTSTFYDDGDGDGYGAGSPVAACSAPSGHVTANGDADDADSSVFPGAPELDDGKDNDQDGSVDEGLDADGDGYTPVAGGDCDDDDGSVSPAGVEVADDGVDQNCSSADLVTYFADDDSDGYGDATSGRTSETGAPAGHVSDSTDCDDTADAVHPGATEVADDGVDQNCSSADLVTYFADDDADTYGDVTSVRTSESGAPTGHVSDSSDCDDTADTVHPGATEVADDAVDQNCSGADLVTYYADDDADTYGDATSTQASETGTPAGHVSRSSDCNDGDDAVHPGAPERDNGVDDDCDGTVDDGLDHDRDGYTPVAGGDCKDGDPWVYPGAPESDNGADDDCDGVVDEGKDGDGDGFTPIYGGDANDADRSIHPGATELCDGKDNDQDGSVDEAAGCVTDADRDGLEDKKDPDTVAAIINGLPRQSFASSGHRSSFQSNLDAVERLLLAGNVRGGIAGLVDLRKRVDGCPASGGRADNNDWITSCPDQRIVRRAIDDLIANLRS